ncbi:MAG: hypothetical protein ABIP03_11410 [Aquihabitans sp.]
MTRSDPSRVWVRWAIPAALILVGYLAGGVIDGLLMPSGRYDTSLVPLLGLVGSVVGLLFVPAAVGASGTASPAAVIRALRLVSGASVLGIGIGSLLDNVAMAVLMEPFTLSMGGLIGGVGLALLRLPSPRLSRGWTAPVALAGVVLVALPFVLGAVALSVTRP